MKVRRYYISNTKYTIMITASYKKDKWIIIDSPPVTRKFIGQNVENLLKWSEKFGDFKYEVAFES